VIRALEERFGMYTPSAGRVTDAQMLEIGTSRRRSRQQEVSSITTPGGVLEDQKEVVEKSGSALAPANLACETRCTR
jgi:hypothetical protein